MKTLIRHSTLAVALLLATGAASAGATVTFANPDNFADMPHEPWVRDQVKLELVEHFGKLAAKLPAGQDLTVEVIDVDLAGRIWPMHRLTHRDLRVLEGGADWPHIKLRYNITQGGNVVKSGEDMIKSMDYMMRINKYSTGDTLRYEKQMLDTWFTTLVAAR